MSDLLLSIKNQIDILKSEIKGGTLSSVISAELIQHQKVLEDWYNKLLSKGGLISTEEEQDAKTALIEAKKAELEKGAKSTKNILTAVLIISISTALVILYIKYKKS